MGARRVDHPGSDRPTVRHATRNSSETAALAVCAINQATWSSKSRV
jgi:hypothetical protein